ncbi:MAG: hypothetical protein SGPRY_000564 [Prymnesium sp.]
MSWRADVTFVSSGGENWDYNASLAHLGVTYLRCERAELSTCRGMGSLNYSAVIDLSAIKGAEVREAAQRFATSHYLLVSSAAVSPSLLTRSLQREEDLTRMAQLSSWWSSEAAAQLEREESLWAASANEEAPFCASVLRLPPVVGRRDSSNRLARLMMMLEMEALPLSAAGHSNVSFVDASSVASALLLLMERAAQGDPCCCGKAFNVASPPASLYDILRFSARTTRANLSVTNSLLPPTFAETVYPPTAYASISPLLLNTSRLVALGWAPAQSLEKAVADASAFIQTQLLNETASERQRSLLVQQLPNALTASPQGIAVLKRYHLQPPFDQPEGWPRRNRSGQAQLPLSFFLVPLVAVLARMLLSAFLVETVTFAALFGWWLCVCLSGSLTKVTMHTAFWVREWFGVSPPFWMAIFSELGLGVLSVGFCIWAICSHKGARFERDATAAVQGVGPRSVLFSIRATVVFFLLGHKISLRFFGDGLGGVPRPPIEFTWPILVITHEPFLTWTDAFLVFTTYGFFALAVCRALHAAFGQVLAVRGAVSVIVLSLPVSLAVMVSIFETHHLLEEAKLLKFAGTTGCVWISLVWLLFLPSFILLGICRTQLAPCPRAGGVAGKVQSVSGRQQSFDDREALVGTPCSGQKRSRSKSIKGNGSCAELVDADDI